jgi:hypothetical protein
MLILLINLYTEQAFVYAKKITELILLTIMFS